MDTLRNPPSDFERSQVWADAAQLVDEVKRLRAGHPPYDILSPEERAEQLAALAPDTRDVTPLRYPGFLALGDDALIAVVADPFTLPGESAEQMVAEASAELARRLFAAERTALEQRDDMETRILTLESEPQPYALD